VHVVVSPDPHRLPRSVLPRRYDLTVAPDLDDSTFSGAVDIDVDVVDPTDSVVLNALDLEIDEAWLTIGSQRVEVEVVLDPDLERITLTPAAPLDAGEAKVSLRFRGTLNDKLRGFYRSVFTDADGTERVIATTQFEATDARRAFPCWDEPDCKAVFGITLVVDEALQAVSNGVAVSDESIGDRRRRVRFADTMPLSTYLVAYIVSCALRASGISRHSVSRWPSSRSDTSPTTSISRTPATRWTSWPSPTSRLARWRTWVASPSARRSCWPILGMRRRASCRTSWMSSPTSSPTCGSATSSP